MADVPVVFLQPVMLGPISMSLERANSDQTGGAAECCKRVAEPAAVCCNDAAVISLFGCCYAAVISFAVSGDRQRRTSIFSAG
jgi:hypothetical protein